MDNVYRIFHALVDRRTGGLEMNGPDVPMLTTVDRRTGGLEILYRRVKDRTWVDRRTGGLESQGQVLLNH